MPGAFHFNCTYIYIKEKDLAQAPVPPLALALARARAQALALHWHGHRHRHRQSVVQQNAQIIQQYRRVCHVKHKSIKISPYSCLELFLELHSLEGFPNESSVTDCMQLTLVPFIQ